MKKRINKPMRAAGILLVATMLTTCMTAGTFAKYVTTDSATDSARVAKFGVVVNANGYLYGKQYVDGATQTTGNTIEAYNPTEANVNTTASVKAFSASSKNVVAPGTKNDTGLGFGVNGVPEVDTKLTGRISGKSIRLNAGSYGVLKPVTISTADQFVTYAATGKLYEDQTSATSLDKNKTYTLVSSTSTASDYTNTVAAYTFYILADECTLAKDYYPVEYKLQKVTSTDSNSSEYTTENVEKDSLKEVIKAIATQYGINSTAISNSAYTNDADGRKAIFASVDFSTATVHQANNDLASEFKLSNQKITWEWKYSIQDANATVATNPNTDITNYDRADTILGNLVAQENINGVNGTGTGADTTFITKGMVVKLDTTNNTATAPHADQEDTIDSDGYITAAGTPADFNLNTSFYMDIRVTQVD